MILDDFHIASLALFRVYLRIVLHILEFIDVVDPMFYVCDRVELLLFYRELG